MGASEISKSAWIEEVVDEQADMTKREHEELQVLENLVALIPEKD